jgi:hypothetical protein
MTRLVACSLFIAIAAGLLAGCNRTTPTPVASGPSTEGAAYWLEAEPPGAVGIKQARADAADQEEVTLVGRIGGETNPWVEGQAAFLLVDGALKPCNERQDDACPTPWDYCCDLAELREHKAMVKVVDAGGQTIAVDARKLLGLKELQTVVVHGQARRDEAGNLTVLADGVYVRN